MAIVNGLQTKSFKKYVLQQSNCNLDASHDREEGGKTVEKSAYGAIKTMRGNVALETENQCSPRKIADRTLGKSDAKKLRSVRLDLSSLKRGAKTLVKEEAEEEDEEVVVVEVEDDGGEDEDEGKNKPRKPRPVVPNYVTNTDEGPCRKPRQNRQDALALSSPMWPKIPPPSLSIARRNARERNRVKQVNEGFATLRSRIPDYISEAYNEEKGRKSAKKLSKVETLRMAVDYIRHLETLLDLKSTDEWIKVEEQPWHTPDSNGYLSPKYQPPCVDSPYDQGFEYQERIFYDYDLDLPPRKEPEHPVLEEKKIGTFAVLGLNGGDAENQCGEDDFKYYETFNRIKKEGGEEKEGGGEENSEEVDLLPKDVIKKAPKKSANVLPSITESFNKTIPVFF